ncbi:MAG: RNA polymerase sigma-70 factor [Niabella sp.]
MLSSFDIRLFQERLSVFDDREAYKKLFYHFYEKLKRFAEGITKSEQMAEDVVGEAFLILWKNRAKLTEIDNLNSYLYIVVKNLALKELGRSLRINSFSIEDINLRTTTETNNTPEDIYLNNEVIQHLNKIVEDLPPRCKLIYKLVKHDGLRYKEISSILNISVKTIDAQMAIASKRITESLRFAFSEKKS